MYTTPKKMLSQFGVREMVQLSDPDLDGNVSSQLLRLTVDDGDRTAFDAEDIVAADAALVRIEDAIESAFLESNSYIFPRYPSPLTTEQIDGSPLAQRNADIARYRLAENRATEEIETRYKAAMSWLKDVQKGMASLGGGDGGVATKTGAAVFKKAESKFDWSGY